LNQKIVAVAVISMVALFLCQGAWALTEEERDRNFSACFNFASLVTGGTVQPHWLEDGSFWWEDRGDTLAVTQNGSPFTPTPESLQTPSDPSLAETPLRDPEISEELAGPGLHTALIIADNLWLESADGHRVQVTDNGNEQQPWSLWGANWSPDGRYLAVQQIDLNPAPTIPIVDWLDPLAPVIREPSTQSREPRMTQQFSIVRAAEALVVPVAGEKDFAEPLWQVTGWAPGTGELLALRFNRLMNRQDLLAIEPATGSYRTVVSERSESFIDGLSASFMMDWYCTDFGDEEHLVWLSQRDGFHHLYLYRYDGTLVRRLTQGDFPVLKIQGIDPEAGWIYFLAKSDVNDPTSQHLCRIDCEGQGFQQLTTSPGRRTVHLSPDFSVFVENHSDLDRPAAAVLRRTNGEFVRQLASADDSPLIDMGWTPPSREVVKAADSVSDCYCALYLPPGFNPDLKYPVIEVIYAGPQWMIVPRRMPAGEYGDTASALAQLGYVVVIIDSPGTAGLGRQYQDVVFERLGMIEIPDHVAALKNLASSRPWMDLSRVGVHGKSWGGYFALRAMLMAPDFYKVGVASSLVADLATTAESPIVPYLGLPQANPAAYESANCLAMADRLQGELLMTIGTADRNTPFGQTMRMVAAFNEAGKDVDLLVLPGQHHWLQGASFDRWQRALRDYFLENLPPETRD
jgi:dipeptidyl aminopeptidase/acylaminoacyl peptidase